MDYLRQKIYEQKVELQIDSIQDRILQNISRCVSEYWVKRQEPLLLSNLKSNLSDQDKQDYGVYFQKVGLKKFLEIGVSRKLFKIVEHPNQQARIGLVPRDSNFSYLESCDRAAALALKNFLESLSSAELQKLSFPAEIVLKLLQNIS